MRTAFITFGLAVASFGIWMLALAALVFLLLGIGLLSDYVHWYGVVAMSIAPAAFFWLHARRNLRLLSKIDGELQANYRRGEQLNGEFIDAPDNDTRRHDK